MVDGRELFNRIAGTSDNPGDAALALSGDQAGKHNLVNDIRDLQANPQLWNEVVQDIKVYDQQAAQNHLPFIDISKDPNGQIHIKPTEYRDGLATQLGNDAISTAGMAGIGALPLALGPELAPVAAAGSALLGGTTAVLTFGSTLWDHFHKPKSIDVTAK